MEELEEVEPKENNTAISSNGQSVIILPFKTANELYRWMDADIKNKKVVFSYVLRLVKKALKYDWENVELFKLDNDNTYAKVDKKDFPQLITKIQKFFVSIEEYESANYCKKLLMKCEIRNLIDP